VPAGFTESEVEQATLDWLEFIGWTIKNGPEIAPGELFAERESYGQVILAGFGTQSGS
jgi:type I restriction enzyme, R subunit